MPPFPKPRITYTVDLAAERRHLRAHATHRQVPARDKDHLLLATWNIANLGLQERDEVHYQLLADIIGRFDLVAIQEVNVDLGGLRAIQRHLPAHYACVFTDAGGNNERSCFVYDASVLSLLELVGEVAVPPSDFRHIKLPGVQQAFAGFDRNPFIASFGWRDRTFSMVTVHSFFGSDSDPADLDRRALETFAVGRWADLESRSRHAYSSDILVMGDFNLPKVATGDPIYEALRKRGLLLPEHTSKVYSNITDDKQYDQIAFLPGLRGRLRQAGIYDMDNALFPDLWTADKRGFRSYMRYYISDHRPYWMQLGV
ncbi:MAG: endonuclease/exonuclease/phosphatase family protein [Flavobacteriales bacterium]|nr:endonuclease/exonuclease/phosphatase family protein [Flavobacteriales bacterium]